MNASKTEINSLAICETVETWMDSLDVPDYPITDPECLGKYAQFVLSLDTQTGAMNGVDLFDRGKGLKSWIQGKVLLKLKPLTAGEKGIVGHGAWAPFLQSIGMDDSTAYWVRRIASTFDRQNAKGLGYTGMVRQLCESFHRATSDVAAKDANNAEKPKDNGGNNKKPTKPKLNESTLLGRLNKIHISVCNLKSELKTEFTHNVDINDLQARADMREAVTVIRCINEDLLRVEKQVNRLKKKAA